LQNLLGRFVHCGGKRNAQAIRDVQISPDISQPFFVGPGFGDGQDFGADCHWGG